VNASRLLAADSGYEEFARDVGHLPRKQLPKRGDDVKLDAKPQGARKSE
jgi:hypothetical protein